MLQVCLNGRRTKADSPHVPVSPAELAQAAQAAVAAGASDIHLHPKRPDGSDTMDPDVVAEVLTAVRAVVDVPVGVTTGEWVELRLWNRPTAVYDWEVLPDHASVNWHEPEALAVTEALLERGVGVDVGMWSDPPPTDPHHSWLWRWLPVRQVLVEVGPDPRGAQSLLTLVTRARPDIPLLLHGEDSSAWPVLRLAQSLGLHTRIGLEDTLYLPDGTPADNAALVAAALKTDADLSGPWEVRR